MNTFPEYVYNKNRVINLDVDFNDLKLGHFHNITESTVDILWSKNDGEDSAGSIIKYNLEDFSKLKLYIDVETNKSFDDPKLSRIQEKMKGWYEIVNEIYNSNGHRIKLDACIRFISKTFSVSDDESLSILKLKIAKNHLVFKQMKAGKFITLAENKLLLEHKKRYLSSISNEIHEQSRRIEFVINHGQTKGNYREELFRTVLRKYIPKKYHIATGFIEGSTKQLDILIYDQLNYIPVFREDDLVVVKKESVMAVIEVKTTLDNNTLLDSLEGFSKLNTIGLCQAPFFKGIFCFKSSIENDKTLAKLIIDFYANNEIELIHGHIDVLCVPKKHCQAISYSNLNDPEPSIPVLEILTGNKGIDIEESYFFQSLFNYLEVDKSAKKINQLYFNELDSTAVVVDSGQIADDDWQPLFTFFSEIKEIHKMDLSIDTDMTEIIQVNYDQVKRRIQSIEKWKNGELTRNELCELYY